MEEEVLLFDEPSTGFEIALGVLILSKAIGSILSLKLIIKDLNVCLHVKRILVSDVAFLFICSILMGTGYVLIFWLELKNSMSCGLLVDIIPLMNMFHGLLAMMISMLRYHMNDKIFIDDSKIKTWFIDGMIVVALLILILILLSLFFGVHISFLAPKCYVQIVRRINLVYIYGFISFTSIAIISWHDISLVCCVNKKKRLNVAVILAMSISKQVKDKLNRQITQIEENKKNRKNVPVISSIIITPTITMVTFSLFAVFMFDSKNVLLTQWSLFFCTLLNILHVPILIIFTHVSHGKKIDMPNVTTIEIHGPGDCENASERNDNDISEPFGGFMVRQTQPRKSVISLVTLSPVELLNIHLSIEKKMDESNDKVEQQEDQMADAAVNEIDQICPNAVQDTRETEESTSQLCEEYDVDEDDINHENMLTIKSDTIS